MGKVTNALLDRIERLTAQRNDFERRYLETQRDLSKAYDGVNKLAAENTRLKRDARAEANRIATLVDELDAAGDVPTVTIGNPDLSVLDG